MTNEELILCKKSKKEDLIESIDVLIENRDMFMHRANKFRVKWYIANSALNRIKDICIEKNLTDIIDIINETKDKFKLVDNKYDKVLK